MKKLIAILLLTGVSAAIAQSPEKNKMTEQMVVDAYNSSNFDALDKFIDINANDHGLPPNSPNGLEGSKIHFKQSKTAFPDGKLTIIEQIAEGDYVVDYMEFTGTNTGSLMGMPPKNKMVKVKSIHLIKFNKMGKAVEHWEISDDLAFLQQLGLFPASQPLIDIAFSLPSDGKIIQTSSEENKMASLKFFELYSKKDIEGVLKLLSSNFRVQWESQPATYGLGTYKMLGEIYLKGFPDFQWTNNIMVAEGDKVASFNTVTATHTGDFMGIAPTNKKITVNDMTIDHYVGGKIAERIQVNDDFTLLKQIGVIPMNGGK